MPKKSSGNYAKNLFLNKISPQKNNKANRYPILNHCGFEPDLYEIERVFQFHKHLKKYFKLQFSDLNTIT